MDMDKANELDASQDSDVRQTVQSCRRCKKRHRGVYEKRPGSDAWYVRVADRGRIVRKKVGAHGLALKMYEQFKAQIAEGRFFPQHLAAQDERLADALRAYLERRDDLEANWRRIGEWWMQQPEVKGRTVREFAEDPDAGEAIQRRRTTTVAASTWNHDVAFLHAFYEHYETRRRRRHPGTPPISNPMKGLRLAEDNNRVRWLSDEEENRLRAQLPDVVDWAKVLVAMHSGARRGNVFALRWSSDVSFDPPTVRRWSRKGRTKRSKVDWIPMNADLLRVLRDLPSRGRSEWVFPNIGDTGPQDPKNWYRRVFKPALDRAGIRNFRFHDLKHTTGSRLRKAGVPIEDIAVALQHSDTRMSLRYAHMAPGRLADVMQTLVRNPSAGPTLVVTDPRTDPGVEDVAEAAGGEVKSAARTG